MIHQAVAKRWFKTTCQSIAFFLINGHVNFFSTLTIYQGRLKSICVPVLNCHSCPLAMFSCPLGSIQYFIMTGRFSYYLTGLIMLVGVTAGRIGCGLLCPFGFFQDLLFRLGYVRIPLARGYTYIKYGILIGVVGILTYYLSVPAFCKLCPAGLLEAGYPMTLVNETVRSRLFNPETGHFYGWFFLVKTLLLSIILWLALRIKRVFCRALCPVGALFSFFSKLSMIHIRVDTQKCTSCKRCARLCPVDLDIYNHQDSPECILCMKCTSCDCITPDFRYPLPWMNKNVRT